jgi:hypothetical protein
MIPYYSNEKLASDIYASTKKLLKVTPLKMHFNLLTFEYYYKETVAFKNMWRNQEPYGDQLWKVTEALGVLYINVAATAND